MNDIYIAVDQNQRNWATLVHVGALLVAFFTSLLVGVGGMIVPLVVWIMKKDQSPFIARHASQAFNFNFSMFIYSIIAVAVAVLTLGIALLVIIPLCIALSIVWLICTIIAANEAYNGRDYTYPFSIQILK